MKLDMTLTIFKGLYADMLDHIRETQPNARDLYHVSFPVSAHTNLPTATPLI
jgi:hypothetical protein